MAEITFEEIIAEHEKVETEYKPDPLIDTVVSILKQYAEEAQIPPRSTSDLSPFEQWLLIRIHNERIAAQEAMDYVAANAKNALIEHKAINK